MPVPPPHPTGSPTMGSARTNSTTRRRLRRKLEARGWTKAQIDNEIDSRGLTPAPQQPSNKPPWQPPGKRKVCTKTKYRDSIGAMMAAANIGAHGRDINGKMPWRAYRCPDCNGWHLTSQAKR